MKGSKTRGFSLIELLIVVAIILIIAAIAIPNYWKARMAANESAATSAIRTINTAEISYIAAYPTVGYATITALAGASPCTPSSATACFIDNNLATATAPPGKSGYVYGLVNAPSTYFISAVPNVPSTSGTRSFCSTEDGVIRYNSSGAAIGSRAGCAALLGLQ
jgi:prepilin-type N-terminal cleavage/methylation domain-containing protein